MTAKARIYIRVSKNDQEEAVILANQERDARGHVRSGGMKLAAPVYREVASGGDPDRSVLSKLMKEARRGDIVIFTSLSRMTRGGIGAALDILHGLEARGIGWHFVEQPLLNFDSTTPKLVKDILLAILAAVDEDYRRRIGAATRAAYARRKALADARGETIRWGRPKKGHPPDVRRQNMTSNRDDFMDGGRESGAWDDQHAKGPRPDETAAANPAVSQGAA